MADTKNSDKDFRLESTPKLSSHLEEIFDRAINAMHTKALMGLPYNEREYEHGTAQDRERWDRIWREYLNSGVQGNGFTITPTPSTLCGYTISCHRCGKTSHHPKDVEHRYCAFCKRFHEDAP